MPCTAFLFFARPPEGRKPLRKIRVKKYYMGGKNATKKRFVQTCILFVEPPRE